MKAATLVRPGEVMVTDDWPEPVAGPGDVVVAVRAVGVCGSDLTVIAGHRPVPRLPWVLGHEAVGDIVRIGPSVTDRAVGQRVVVEPNYPCLVCDQCRSGTTSLCPNRRIAGINEPGLLAERVAVPAGFTWPVAADLPLEDLVCAEPLAVALGAIDRVEVRRDEPCLVIGAGSQGLLVCLALLSRGVTPTVVDPNEGRLATAIGLGAVDGTDAVRIEGDGERFAVVFETSGAPAALEQAVEVAAADARIAVIGQSEQPAQLSTFTVVQRRLTIVGCLIYDHPNGFAQTTDALATIHPGQVLRGRFGLDDAARAFREARDQPGKPWISFEPARQPEELRR
jgi:threonine dehydrogenase-like Zn-dependent dehydrogenase